LFIVAIARLTELSPRHQLGARQWLAGSDYGGRNQLQLGTGESIARQNFNENLCVLAMLGVLVAGVMGLAMWCHRKSNRNQCY